MRDILYLHERDHPRTIRYRKDTVFFVQSGNKPSESYVTRYRIVGNLIMAGLFYVSLKLKSGTKKRLLMGKELLYKESRR